MRRISSTLVLLLAAAYALPAHTAQLYKCKGASGETIYQSDPCPEGATLIAQGSFDRQPDDPNNQEQAAAEGRAAAVREQERRDAKAESAPAYAEDDSGSAYMSETARRNAEVEANSYKSRIGHRGPPQRKGYEAANASTLPNPLNGGRPIPVGDAAAAQTSSSRRAPAPAQDVQMHRAPEPPVMITDCHGGAANSVTCYDTAGNMHMGRTDPAGNTEVYGADGTLSRLPRNACIKDDFGKCK